MKIAIFARFSRRGLAGGVEDYTEKIILALLEHSDVNVSLFTSKDFFDGISLKTMKFSNRFSFFDTSGKNSCQLIKMIIKEAPDIIHFPLQTIQLWNTPFPKVISLHDLQHKYYPKFFKKNELEYREKYYKLSAKLSDGIVVSFRHVKRDIRKFYGIDSSKIFVTGLGIDNRFVNIKEIPFPEINKELKIPKDYILYPAQTWPHKNHINLLKALLFLKQKGIIINCVCTGRKNDFFYKRINNFILQHKMGDQIYFTDFVPVEILKTLYKNAKAVVIPTLYEAGSFPLFEAISLEIPVICSNVTSLPDTIKNKKFIFNPRNVKEIAEKILKIVFDKKYREENISNSRNLKNLYSWQHPVNRLLDAYNYAIKHYSEKNLTEKIKKHLCCKKKIFISDINKIKAKDIKHMVETQEYTLLIYVYAYSDSYRRTVIRRKIKMLSKDNNFKELILLLSLFRRIKKNINFLERIGFLKASDIGLESLTFQFLSFLYTKKKYKSVYNISKEIVSFIENRIGFSTWFKEGILLYIALSKKYLSKNSSESLVEEAIKILKKAKNRIAIAEKLIQLEELELAEKLLKNYKGMSSLGQKFRRALLLTHIYFESNDRRFNKYVKFAYLFYNHANSQDLLSLSKLLISSGLNEEAKVVLKHIIKNEMDKFILSESYYILGELELTLGEEGWKDTFRLSLKILESLKKDDCDVFLKFVLIYYKLGEIKKAKNILVRIMKECNKNNYSLKTLFIFANVFLISGMNSEFKTIYNIMVKTFSAKKKKRPYDFYLMASIFQKIKEYKKAKRLFKKVVSETKEKTLIAGAYFHLGEIALSEGRKKEAKEHFEKCLTVNPSHKKALEYLKNL